jgi:Domain of unknown function (DUF4394)/Calx-beta domain/Domain of unknown function (DUF4214)
MLEFGRIGDWNQIGIKRARQKQRPPASMSPSIELLEARMVPTTLVGLTTNNQLAIFDSSSPGNIANIVPLTGMFPGENMVSIDVRPLNGKLYGLGSSSRVYLINPDNGVASAVGLSSFTPSLNGAFFGFNFDPTSDLVRAISNAGQNLRLDPSSGAIDGPNNTLAAFTSLTPPGMVVATAFSNKVAGATSTTLFGIDSGSDQLVEIGGPNGNPSPNLGAVTNIGPLGIPTTANVGFEIAPDGTAYASLSPANGGSQLVTVNLGTGTASPVGAIGNNLVLRGLTALDVSNQQLGGSIHFSQAIYTVSQSSPTAVVTIVRDGTNLGPATVNFATFDGTAQAGLDYTPVNQLVTFAAGQSTTTVTIGILTRALPTNSVSLNLALTSPSSDATLGSPSSALLTIQVGLVPVGDPNAVWLGQVYKDLLGRTIDPGGLAYWGNLLTQPFISRYQVAFDIATSVEYKVHFIETQFIHYFGALPDPATLSSQLQFMLQGGTDDLAKATMLGSPALFFQTGANNVQFISFLYQDVLGRPVDTQSLLLSSNALAFGLTRGQLALDVLSTPEADLVEVSNLYQTLLRRNADPGGLSFFANMLQRGTSDEAVIASLVSSNEYYQNAQAGF